MNSPLLWVVVWLGIGYLIQRIPEESDAYIWANLFWMSVLAIGVLVKLWSNQLAENAKLRKSIETLKRQ
jgi:membrane protein DedA with SNARE-associated domain